MSKIASCKEGVEEGAGAQLEILLARACFHIVDANAGWGREVVDHLDFNAAVKELGDKGAVVVRVDGRDVELKEGVNVTQHLAVACGLSK